MAAPIRPRPISVLKEVTHDIVSAHMFLPLDAWTSLVSRNGKELMREVVGVRQQIGGMNDDERRAQAARMALKFAEALDLLDEEDE